VLKVLLVIGILMPLLIWGRHVFGGEPDKKSTLHISELFQHHNHGIDVSHYQGTINWKQVAQDKVSFAYIKATGGETYTDPDFFHNWHHVRTTDIRRGAYHFFFAADDPVDQAKHFLSKISDLREHDLPPALDLEVSDHMPAEIVAERALVWLKEVEKSTKRIPVLYTNSSFGSQIVTNPAFSRYPLWIADYSTSIQKIPAPWEHSEWTMWQHSQSGTVKGINGHVDLNRFHTKVSSLDSFIKKSRTDSSLF